MTPPAFSLPGLGSLPERQVWVIPPQRPAGARHAVIFLDGEFYLDRVQGPRASAQVQASSSVAPFWQIYVSHRSLAARWLECPCVSEFSQLLAERLWPAVLHHHPEAVSALHHTLIGLSFTGLSAVYSAGEYPSRWQAVVAQSGSFWWQEAWLPQVWDTRFGTVRTRFGLEVGDKETSFPVAHRPECVQTMSQIEGVERMAAALRKTGHEVRSSRFAGGHDFRAWADTLPAWLEWAQSPPRVAL